MLSSALVEKVIALRRQTPDGVWQEVCRVLAQAPEQHSLNTVIATLNATTNADLIFHLRQLLSSLHKHTDWEGLALALELAGSIVRQEDERNHIEPVWTGPDGATHLRRLEQVLYDCVASATKRILLVTFAAFHIRHLNRILELAVARNLKLRLILEFEQTSEGQLSFDAVEAFSHEVLAVSEILFWSTDKRTRNTSGRPGKLHVKCAVIDHQTIVSSANLTDDAFNRNMELGVLSKNPLLADQLWKHFESLRLAGTLTPYEKP